MADRRRLRAIAAALCLQGLAAIFFVVDAAGDVREAGVGPHLLIEAIIAAGLLLGVALGAVQLHDLLAVSKRQRATIQAASGAMSALMQLRFAEWHLTAAEADVALLALKGLNGEEIAVVRGAAPGTVRAQLTRVYAKAGVSSRAGLIGLFVEDLLGAPLDAPTLSAIAAN
jgi:DNA-binding CsgD family transcriptional regulator